MHPDAHSDLMYRCIFQYSMTSRLWARCVHDAINKRVHVNGIIVDVQEPESEVDCGFLPITIRGELGMDFLGTCFDMGGWLRRQRSVVELGVGDEWQALL